MAKRISSSQFRSKMNQIQSKLRQAASKQRQAVNNYNQSVRTYNSKVQTHNARVRANRERLKRELEKLARSPSKTQHMTLKTSVQTVTRSYERLDQAATTGTYGNRLNHFLDLSEREAANSVGIMNALYDQALDAEPNWSASSIEGILTGISKDIQDRWRGALYALSPQNPDAARHFCTSAREIITEILEKFAADDLVKATLPGCQVTPQGKPTRRSKIRFFLHRHGISDEVVSDFVEDDMENVIQLFQIFNSGTHGESGRFSHSQLLAIRVRVENAVAFLWSVISGEAFLEPA